MPIRGGDLRALHDLIRPRLEELRWLKIPWHVDLWHARRVAFGRGCPLFLWAMDGSPLGFT